MRIPSIDLYSATKRGLTLALIGPLMTIGSVALANGPADAFGSLAERRDQISVEIGLIEAAAAKLDRVSSTKQMSGRGWTALDDIVVGGSILGASAGMYGVMKGLPLVFPNVRLFSAQNLGWAKTGLFLTAIYGAFSLGQGLLVYPFVPKSEITAEVKPADVAAAVAKLDLNGLDLPQADALLNRLIVVRQNLETSAERLELKLAPKFESRLAFIASTMTSGGLAVVAIGGGIFLVTSQVGRFAPWLMRINKAAPFARALIENQEMVRAIGVQQAVPVLVQGVATLLAGAGISAFVPKGTASAAPVQ